MMKTDICARIAAAAVSLLAFGCDRIGGGSDMRPERTNRMYQEAMADYSAGRLEAAQRGFEKVIRSDPSNASARFQLACMLQDRKADYLAAYCGYQEYLLREPKSDKAALARERAAICRTEAAKAIAKEMGFAGGAEAAQEAEAAKSELEAAKKKLAKAERALSESEAKAARLETENARLRRMVASIGDDAPARTTSAALSAAELLDDDDDGETSSRMAPLPEAAMLADYDDEPADMRGEALDEARKLGTDESASVVLPADRTPAATKLSDMASRKKHKGDFGPADVSRPDSYVVQEGDTLYKIAVKFYGKSSAWRKIREANKATVSTDGRIQKGQRLVLP